MACLISSVSVRCEYWPISACQFSIISTTRSRSSRAPTALPSIKPLAQAAAILRFDLNKVQLFLDPKPIRLILGFIPTQAAKIHSLIASCSKFFLSKVGIVTHTKASSSDRLLATWLTAHLQSSPLCSSAIGQVCWFA